VASGGATVVPQRPVELTLRRKAMSNWLVAALFSVGLLAAGGGADVKPTPRASAKPDDKGKDKKPDFRTGAVRYQVKDVDKSVQFYTKHLGFKVEQQFGAGAAFASVSNGSLTLWLSGQKSSGSRAMPDGRKQEPGGWNRIVLEVDDLPTHVEAMKKAGLSFRNEIEKGPGGKQIQLEDLDGSPIELFEPAR
jgi:glyoxylase I family protein